MCSLRPPGLNRPPYILELRPHNLRGAERVRKAEEMMLDEVPEQQSRDGLLSRVGASLRVQTGAVCTEGQLADTTGPCLPWPSAECGLPHRPEEMG